MAYSFICWKKWKKVFFLLIILLALIWFLGLGGQVEANRLGRSSEPISIKAVVGGNFNLQFPPIDSNPKDHFIECFKDDNDILEFKEEKISYEHDDFKGRMKVTHDSIEITNFTNPDEGNYSCCSRVITATHRNCISQTVVVLDKEAKSKGIRHNDAVSPAVSPTTTPNTEWTIGWIFGIFFLVVGGLAFFVVGIWLCYNHQKKKKRSADAKPSI